MAIQIKTKDEIEKMRISGKLAASVLEMITPYVKEGVTTDHLNELCHNYIVEDLAAIPAPLNYKGFPKSICTSINHVICHGIPGPKKLKKGDILNIDVTVIKDGYHGDTSKMFFIGNPPLKAKQVTKMAHQCMWRGIHMVKPGAHVGDIGHAIQTMAEQAGFSVVREFCGHGIGRGFHEDPEILHFGVPGVGPELLPGMTFTIEPMINAGKRHMKILPDGWTAVTKDRSPSGQWEHTILVTESGAEVLTLREEERACSRPEDFIETLF